MRTSRRIRHDAQRPTAPSFARRPPRSISSAAINSSAGRSTTARAVRPGTSRTRRFSQPARRRHSQSSIGIAAESGPWPRWPRQFRWPRWPSQVRRGRRRGIAPAALTETRATAAAGPARRRSQGRRPMRGPPPPPDAPAAPRPYRHPATATTAATATATTAAATTGARASLRLLRRHRCRGPLEPGPALSNRDGRHRRFIAYTRCDSHGNPLPLESRCVGNSTVKDRFRH